MRKLLMFLLFAFWAVPTFAQCPVWSRTYGGGNGYSVQQTTDGGYIVTGWTYSFGAGGEDVYLIKTDVNGDTLWSRTYGGTANDVSLSVQQTTDGGYIVAGYTTSFGAGGYDAYLIKTDSMGDTLWSRTYGGSSDDRGWSLQQTIDGGYIVAGNYADNVYLLKTDSLGDTLWSRTYGGGGTDDGLSVQQTTDGGYIVAGYTTSFGAGGYDAYLIKTDSMGDTLWSRTYGGSNWDEGYSVQQTTDGGYILAGLTYSLSGGPDDDMYLIKTNSTGEPLWTRTYGWVFTHESGTSVQQTEDGGYIVAGWTDIFYDVSDFDVYLIKTDSGGDIQWSHTYGGSGFDITWSVQQTTDGGYIVAGYTESFGAGNGDAMLTKLDSSGNTCIGEFLLSDVMSVSPMVTSPATVVTSPTTIVTSPPTTVTSPTTEVTTVCVAIRGDANGDGVINSADIVYLINYLFINGPVPDPLWVGDCNCDGVINSADVVYLINYLFIGGPPPCC